MLQLVLQLAFIEEFLGDMNFAIKLVALLFIIGYTRVRFGFGLLPTFLTVFFAFYVLFQNWNIFGPLTMVYLLLFTGLSQLVMDSVFVSMQLEHEAMFWKMSPDQMKAQAMGGGQTALDMKTGGMPRR